MSVKVGDGYEGSHYSLIGYAGGGILYRSGWTGWLDTTNKAGKGLYS